MKSSLARKAYRSIRHGMLLGRFTPGDRLSDYKLATELGLSRTPVRLALQQLVSDGLVQQDGNRGAFIIKPDRQDITEIGQMRELIECFAVTYAAENMPMAQREELLAIGRRFKDVIRANRRKAPEAIDEDKGDLSNEVDALDLEFHALIIRSTMNRRLIKAAADCKIVVGIIKMHTTKSLTVKHRNDLLTCRDHLRVARAIHRGDAASASFWMKSHIRGSTRESLRRYELLSRGDYSGGKLSLIANEFLDG